MKIENAKKRITESIRATISAPFGTSSKRDLSTDIKMNPGPGYYENSDTPLLNFVVRDTSKDMVQAVNVQCFGTTLKRFDDYV